MTKKDYKLESFSEAETIIGETVLVKGNFESNGNLVINGMLEGDIKTKGAVLIGEKAKINANIVAQEMVVKGTIEGNLEIEEYLAIGSSAKILGNIQCSQISIEKGAQISGKVSIGTESEPIKETSPTEDQTENYSA